MPNLLEEDRISLTKLAQREGVNVCTVWRWSQRGVKGFQLETISVGGRRQTSFQAFSRFVTATTAAAAGVSNPSRTNRQREAANNRAERELAAEGI